MTYVVKARARLDLKSHWRYIANDNVQAADRLLEAAEETFKFLARNPGTGSERNFRKLIGVRSFGIHDFRNYLVFYQRRGNAVVIVRVLHGMRDLPRLFEPKP
jgi:toxin ParE1/3/4